MVNRFHDWLFLYLPSLLKLLGCFWISRDLQIRQYVWWGIGAKILVWSKYIKCLDLWEYSTLVLTWPCVLNNLGFTLGTILEMRGRARGFSLKIIYFEKKALLSLIYVDDLNINSNSLTFLFINLLNLKVTSY